MSTPRLPSPKQSFRNSPLVKGVNLENCATISLIRNTPLLLREKKMIYKRKMGEEELRQHLMLRGRGRRFTDRKKQGSRRACRGKVNHSESTNSY